MVLTLIFTEKHESVWLNKKKNDHVTKLLSSSFHIKFLSRTKTEGLLQIRINPFSPHCFSHNYVAPEVINNKGYNGAKVDLSSCGVILSVLMADYLPFEDSNLVGLYKKFSWPTITSPWSTDGEKNLEEQSDLLIATLTSDRPRYPMIIWILNWLLRNVTTQLLGHRCGKKAQEKWRQNA
ncbi:hypothetical protein V6N13_097488 [Hibiscus sabdariffa]|uniref:Protein kinase domain-containing protein n=1 Tax=Hibiscus sabdariffa TaxID=183260 RepID=A0ABR2PCT8_9ROSI